MLRELSYAYMHDILPRKGGTWILFWGAQWGGFWVGA